MKNYEIIYTCYHEAGHAIIGLVNNIFIPKVFVKKDGSGWTDFKRIFPNKKRMNQT